MAGRVKVQLPPLAGILSWLRGALAGHRVQTIGAQLALMVILLLWPLVGKSDYALEVMTQAGLYAILTLSVGLVLGQAGQPSFGHSAFYGIGAYTCGLLVYRLEVPTLAAWMAGAVAAGAVAVLIGRPVLKLKYFYVALTTIGLGQVFLAVVTQVQWAGGSNGLGPIKALNIFGFEFDTHLRKYYMVWVLCIAILLFLARLLRHRSGRALRALADSETASSTVGVRAADWKLRAFVFNAVFCGLAGGMFVFVYAAIDPTPFSFGAALLPIIMMLLGGPRRIWGGIVGAVIMTWVAKGFSGATVQYNGVRYSVILLLLLLLLPAGILGFRPQMAKRLWAGMKGEPLPAVSVSAAPAPAAAGAIGSAAPATGVRRASGFLREELAQRREEISAAGPLLRVEDVSVHFGGLKALSRVSFEVEEGSITALVGPNGAGKTTLINAISRLEGATGGRIWFGDRELTELDAASAARLGIARTFQSPRILANMTLLENVLMGCHRREKSGFWADGLGFVSQRREEERSRARALDALALVGLQDQADASAFGLTRVQQRLVEIARALASVPWLLVLDEPAAGMNQRQREDLMALIRTIRGAGVTVLLADRDLDLVKDVADTVNALNYGKLMVSGSTRARLQDLEVVSTHPGAGHIARDLCSTRDLVDGESCPVLEDVLAVEDLVATYGRVEALRELSLTVQKGIALAVLGANGAGKSTLLGAISGIVRSNRGRVLHQAVDITRMPPEKIVARGICHVPEGRQLFPTLTVEDNLIVGATGRRDRKALADDIAHVYDLFPILGERRRQQAGTLSGEEQQMLAIGRALTGRPNLLLLDEPTMGLAPPAVERIFEALARLNEQGLTMLVAEQNAEMALSLAHRALVLRTGKAVFSGTATQLQQDAHVLRSYEDG